MDELVEGIEPACWFEVDDEPVLDVHAVAARARATAALPMVIVELRNDMDTPASWIMGLY